MEVHWGGLGAVIRMITTIRMRTLSLQVEVSRRNEPWPKLRLRGCIGIIYIHIEGSYIGVIDRNYL